MKYLKFFLPALFSLSLVLASCSSAEQKHDAAKTDTLISLLDSASFYLNQLDTQKIQTAFDDYMIHMKDIETFLVEKPEKEEWQLLGRYGMIRKPLRDYKKNRERLIIQIEEQRAQLLILKKKRLKGRISSEEFNEYFAQERELATNSHFEAVNLHKFTRTYLDEYYQLNDEAVAIIEKIKEKASR